MKHNYKVVGEFIHHSALYELEKDSSELTSNAIIDNYDFQNYYWAIVEVDKDGCYMATIEDDFKNAMEAWKRYYELTGENK